MSELTDTAREMAEDTARAEEVLGEPLNAQSEAPPVPTIAELKNEATRALLRLTTELANGANTDGLENVAEALRAMDQVY